MLSSNSLTDLPDSISGLAQPSMLQINDNALANLPSTIIGHPV
ncbi:MAG: hypothetical protein R2873_03400 [Caldilineaceae bacterium]